MDGLLKVHNQLMWKLGDGEEIGVRVIVKVYSVYTAA
jgi:hypothetical protein